jgi:N-acetylglucosamine kinase-like BadF-type ATPase
MSHKLSKNQMIIADSGSTKTTWRISKNEHEFIDIHTDGINPYFQSSEDIASIVKKQLLPQLQQDWLNALNVLYYYGAGCSNEQKITQVETGLKAGFANWQVNVDHDLLASARSLLGNKSGIACILGTGSNSCLFIDGKIKENIASWGYLFGDYGSGAHIGKELVQRYANNLFSNQIKKELESAGIDREVILNQVYQKPLPNRYLASFSKIAGNLIQHHEINELVISCFEKFFIHQVEIYTNYSQHEVSFVGSISHHFSKQVHEAAKRRNIKIGKTLKEPMDGLFNYYVKQTA